MFEKKFEKSLEKFEKKFEKVWKKFEKVWKKFGKVTAEKLEKNFLKIARGLEL
jgi:hypothetical protein